MASKPNKYGQKYWIAVDLETKLNLQFVYKYKKRIRENEMNEF